MPQPVQPQVPAIDRIGNNVQRSVERTFAWLGRCRRLPKDFENLTRNALAFIRLASIRLMLRKLCSKT
nr:transposase [Rhodoblastus sphagnicola]